MKKTIVFLIIAGFIILACIGGIMKMNFMDQIQRGVVHTDNEVKQFHCIQSSLWFPIGITTGLAFILFPRFFRALVRGSDQIRILLIRIFGLALLILTIIDFWRGCNFYVNLFLFAFR